MAPNVQAMPVMVNSGGAATTPIKSTTHLEIKRAKMPKGVYRLKRTTKL